MRQIARWPNVLFGAWLVLAPFVLGYDLARARWVDVATGLAVVVVALVSTRWSPARFANAALGVWLFLAPFLLGYGAVNAPTINDMALGVFIASAALVKTAVRERREPARPTLSRAQHAPT